MQFDIRSTIITIGPFEPALLISLALASLLAWPVGRGLSKLTGLVGDPWRRLLYIGPVWVLAALALFILTNLILVVAFPMLHPEYREALVCVAIVWPTFLLPAAVGLATGALGLRSRQASRAASSAA